MEKFWNQYNQIFVTAVQGVGTRNMVFLLLTPPRVRPLQEVHVARIMGNSTELFMPG